MASPLPWDISQNVGETEMGVTVGKGVLCKLRLPLQQQTADGCLSAALPEARPACPSLKGDLGGTSQSPV